ncbi:hypothetical protein ACFOQM_01625 [Paenibacillus sp. GCM10012307]|uniref:Transposase IS204/IS1001/IS1096/IS1165 DDE domain-containing protein n=1 Tax=Paenibacillus roseus TaxID=2798579 RepID=A0A934J1T9_9BACL|nr:hypothetical protein [Paenibacillus roseus]MBJ6360019.1 hypothetical protein [Paenibacillus roseus]
MTRGHRYITLFVDVDHKTVLFATEGKGMDTLERFKSHLTAKGAAAQQIEDEEPVKLMKCINDQSQYS